MVMKNFALTGVAGFIAPRHLQAIKDTGNTLIAAMDPHDSVGILDRFFPCAQYFREFERFERHLEKLRHESHADKIDYISICSPNYLHDSHIRLALRLGADAICEKPLVLNPWNLDALEMLEKETGRHIYTILQLRVHPSLIKLKTALASEPGRRRHRVLLTYITSRGSWYLHSWKGAQDKSGGLATNIGIHLFDLVIWLFGNVRKSTVHVLDEQRGAGFLELEHADVQWFLSINAENLPTEEKQKGKTTYRHLSMDDTAIEFSEGFTDLHTRVYEQTFDGKGFTIKDSRPSIELVHNIRLTTISPADESAHPLIRNFR
jgi:UDP-N-acetyl-2-amino-2-deoxyglucuronate dehydrogenase